MDQFEKRVQFRIRFARVVFVLAFCLIAGRAFYLQVLQNDDLRERAERQHQRVIPLTPQRGTIFDRNGEELAVSIDVDSVYVNPGKVEADGRQVRELAEAVSLSPRTVRAKLDSSRGFLWLKRRVSPRESEAVRELDISGVNFVKEHRRYYPNSELAAHLLGFTGIDPEGLEGLELQYDSALLGRGGYLVTERDALGRGLSSDAGAVRGARGGNDVVLTIDRTLQYIAEKELKAGVEKSGAKAGVAVIIEPETGKVLAMAGQPGYNPNAIFRYQPGDWRNKAVCDSFEPGSTFKVFLLAAALDAGIVEPGQHIDCEQGDFRVGGKVIHDHKPFGDLTLADMLRYSSNIGFAKIGKQLERDEFSRYIEAFGFGAKTGIDLPGESAGIVRDADNWFEMDLAAISFGQGISVTALQMAMATAAIANGGYLMQPYVVDRMTSPEGRLLKKARPKMIRRVISHEVAQAVRGMMVGVTEAGGTGALGAVPGFPVAGKTGTAQKVDPVTGGYSVDKRTASFVGIVPADDPRLVVLVVVDEPQGKPYGGIVAAPVFARIADQALRYLNVSPRQDVDTELLPALTVRKQAAPGVLPVAMAGTGRTQDQGRRMPDFLGMSYRQALQLMERSGLNIKMTGSGRVVEQNPSPGEAIQYGSEVRVRFAAIH
ncbi:MAG: transpeptidase family protein [Desulfuromonadales bacterium]|nr:transpeptidase family protein [Desulfuromonadales bacterium]NIS41221.1 transpeptidase family protein [Desulfuromonadales bacterium]